MLLMHQTGTVKVGEVVRYTLTYNPSQDRIVPTAPTLSVKIKNTSAVALRAAYLHGPYTLYAACYPSVFDPNDPRGNPETYGYPHFEPNLKAGGSWNAQLKVPEDIRETFVSSDNRRHSAQAGGSATWIIEISSQVLFSLGAAVHYELLVGRDEKSVDLGILGAGGISHAAPGALQEFQDRRKVTRSDLPQSKGVYSQAIHLTLSDTAALWNTPQLPGQDEERRDRSLLRTNPALSEASPTSPKSPEDGAEEAQNLAQPKTTHREERQKIHLVLITHGLHSNLGADMLYLKESIDAAARKARLDRTMRKAKRKVRPEPQTTKDSETDNETEKSTSTKNKEETDDTHDGNEDEDEDDDEQVIVRGFPGNAVKTERGIQYLGKRLAKYVLAMTYPDQPYIPVKKKSLTRSFTSAFGASDKQPPAAHMGHETHHRSTIRKEPLEETNLAYQITSISFIGHSLGGLVQTYAIAYIQKHSPEFFTLIKPVNFISLASPFLGLSNENPLYVKFALDFGLVGRTGQDLGLTWRAPTMVRSGWGAMIGGIGTEGQRRRSKLEPGSKPLLRILPAGPAHQVLRLFRNRTIYSNVVNDGIVPLRTSCLLFLDWRGLGRVDKARRGNGLVGTMAGWGWAEITGQNATEQLQIPNWRKWWNEGEEDSDAHANQSSATVPQPDDDAIADHANVSAPSSPTEESRSSLRDKRSLEDEASLRHTRSNSDSGPSPFAGFLAMLRPGGGSSTKAKSPTQESKHTRIYKRSQTLKVDDFTSPEESAESTPDARSPTRPGMARGESALQDYGVIAPPTTSVLESAGDILNPPLPTKEYITEPNSRPRTIFHDRVYHPEDIPPPLLRPKSFFRRTPSYDARVGSQLSNDSTLLDTESAKESELTKSNPTSPTSKSHRLHQSINSNLASESSRIDSSKTSASGSTRTATNSASPSNLAISHMKVEEKIARAYHRDLSWRKVLVRLEPDAHNNIVVRRMFANAYGWPVVKHLVDTHFADSMRAKLADIHEEGIERAKPMHASLGGEEVTQPTRRSTASNASGKGSGKVTGGAIAGIGPGASAGSTLGMANLGLSTSSNQVIGSPDDNQTDRGTSRGNALEGQDDLFPLPDVDAMTSSHHSGTSSRRTLSRIDSAQWDDRFFDSEDDEDDDEAAFDVWRGSRNIAAEDSRVTFNPERKDQSGGHTQPFKPRPRDIGLASPSSAKIKGTNPTSPVRLGSKGTVALPHLHSGAASPPASGGGSTSEVGLRKSLEEVIRKGSSSKQEE